MAIAHPNSPPATHIEVEIIHGLHHRKYRYEYGRAKSAIFLSFLIIVMDASAGASMVNQNSFSGVEEWPSYEIPYDASDPVEEPGWWLSFGYDTNSNGMDDRLEA